MRFWMLVVMIMCITQTARAEEVSYDFDCEALSQKEIYKKHRGFENLVEGQGDWVFSTKNDFKTNFALNRIGQRRLARLSVSLKKQGIDLVIALVPTRGMMHGQYALTDMYSRKQAWASYKELSLQMQSAGISVATVYPEVAPEDFFYKTAPYWTAVGAREMAKSVAKQVKALPSYTEIEKKKYYIDVENEGEYYGSFANFINSKCDAQLEKEVTQKYSSNFEVGTKEGPAEIILVGTGNSISEVSSVDFSGFLKKYMSANVDVLSVDRQGADMALYRWLHTQSYKDKAHKIVVWEMPVHQNLKNDQFFRQLVPAVNGDCSEEAVVTEEAAVSAETSLFSSIWDDERLGESLYARFDFEDNRFWKMQAITSYDEGPKDVEGLRRAKVYDPDGVFYYEFQQRRKEPITDFYLKLPPNVTGNVKASLCSYPF